MSLRRGWTARQSLAENVYNMDEIGVLLGVLGALKVLVRWEEVFKYRGAAVKRKMATAVECLSADRSIVL